MHASNSNSSSSVRNRLFYCFPAFAVAVLFRLKFIIYKTKKSTHWSSPAEVQVRETTFLSRYRNKRCRVFYWIRSQGYSGSCSKSRPTKFRKLWRHWAEHPKFHKQMLRRAEFDSFSISFIWYLWFIKTYKVGEDLRRKVSSNYLMLIVKSPYGNGHICVKCV